MRNQTWFDAQLERIDRSQGEIHKQMATLSRLSRRDPWLLILAALIAAFAAIIVRLPELLAAFGLPH